MHVVIARSSMGTLLEALELVFRDLAPANRQHYVQSLAEGIRAGRISAEGLLEARRRGRLVGAVFAQSQVGRTAVVWPPRVTAGEPATTLGRLWEAATTVLADQRVRVVHVLLERPNHEDDRTLRAAGYELLAELLYLGSEESQFPRRWRPTLLDFEPYCAANHDRLVRAVEATYEGTLDCPQLNGVRTVEEVLAGYRATGQFDPARWLIARRQDRDVGCLLLADHPNDGAWELVYMGLAPAARGRGWGIEIARHAQWLTGQAGRSRLVLAVDAANRPGIAMYAAAGFQQWDRRLVYWRLLAGA